MRGETHKQQVLCCDWQRVACPLCRGLTAERSKEAGQDWRENEASQTALKLAIEQVLRLIYEEHYEVPFISCYRKEVCL